MYLHDVQAAEGGFETHGYYSVANVDVPELLFVFYCKLVAQYHCDYSLRTGLS